MFSTVMRRSNNLLRIAVLFFTVLAVSAALYIAQVPASRPAFSLSALPPLTVGDWVFRAGTSAESQLIQTLSNSEFSHLGMIVSLQPEPLIVHATTNDDPQRANQVLASTLSEFVDPKLAHHFAIARPSFVTGQQQQQAAKQLLQQLGQPFVLAERSTAHLYCTTLLADALQHSATPFQPEWQQINAPLLSGEYLFPEAFAKYPGIDWLYHSANAQTPE